MKPAQPGSERPVDTIPSNLQEETLPPRPGLIEPPHGVLHGREPLNFDAAVERSFLVSVAQELATRRRIESSLPRWNPEGPSTVRNEDGSPLMTMHLLGEEVIRGNGSTEFNWARTSRRFARLLTNETRELLDSIVRLADERELGLFHTSYLRASAGPVPLGRLIAGLAGELVERPLSPFGIVHADSTRAIFRWYLIEEHPQLPPNLNGSEGERIRFCQDVIGLGFRDGHHVLSRPLEAIVALGKRVGLLSGMSDERTAYIASPNELDSTGERLALVARPGPLEGWAPGLSVCWAHHDTIPRPTETLRPRA